MENWKKKTGADLVRVPFKGGGDTVTNMLSGVTPVGFLGLGNFLSYIRAGQVTPILVDADKRVGFIPEVATLAEMGFARDHTRAFFGLLAPAGTPKAITERLRKEIIAIANEPAFMQRHFIDRGLEPVLNTPEEYPHLPRVRPRTVGAHREGVGAVPAVGAASASRHLEQDLRQPLRVVDHDVVPGGRGLEGLPGLVGLALGIGLVEGRLRIFRRADVGLLRDLLAGAGELDRLQRDAVRLRGRSWNRPRPGPSR